MSVLHKECVKKPTVNGSKFKLDLSSQSTSSACTSSISVGDNVVWWVTQARNLGEILGWEAPSSPIGDASISGFLIASALQTSTKGTYPIRSSELPQSFSNWWHALLHLSYFCHDGLPRPDIPTMSLAFQNVKRGPVALVQSRSLPDLESLPHLFLLFQYLPHLSLSSLSYRHHSNYLVSPKYHLPVS